MADEIDAVQSIKKFSGQHQTRLRWWLAFAGDGNGAVYTSQANYYLCRYPLESSPTVEIFNNRINLVDNLRIIVGYTAYQPNLLQVLDVADQRLDSVDINDNPINPGNPGYTSVMPHWVNHQYLGGDSGKVNWRQLSSLGVFPNYPADLQVQVWPGTIPRPGADINVQYQLVDMTSHVPVSGARYSLISFDSSGNVVVTDGTINSGGFGALTNADVPDTPAGNWRSCAIALYDSQAAIVESTTEIDFLDLRFPEERIAGNVLPSEILLADTHILVGNGSGVAADVAMSNDATIANTGAITLKNTGPGATGPIGSGTVTPVITIDAQGRVTALGSASITAGHTIQDEGISLTTRTNLNFTGTGVEATDDAANNATVVTIDAVFSIYNEIQTGTGGVTYYLANIATSNTVRAYVNGIRQPTADDDTNSDVVTFITAPAAGDTLIFDYEAEVT